MPIRSILRVHDWVPQLAVLCHVAVRHARRDGRPSEGLSHGVPMIAVSQVVDQFSNAEMPRRREWR